MSDTTSASYDPWTWFRDSVDEAFGFVRDYGLRPLPMDSGPRHVTATYLGHDVGVVVSYEPLEDYLESSVVLLDKGHIPERRAIQLHLGWILIVSGAESQIVRPREVAGAQDPQSLADLLKREAALLERYAAPLFRGNRDLVDKVRRQLSDVPGNPFLDWWLPE
jgi:hypothetical protein